MIEVLDALESNALSVWIREFPSVFGFPTILFLHTLGLARTMWLGFGINALSGAALLLAYPAKALTNWVFYLKMALVLLGVYLAARINRELAPSSGAGPALGNAFEARRWAVASLLVWAAAIITGRLLAYTHSVLFASELI